MILKIFRYCLSVLLLFSTFDCMQQASAADLYKIQDGGAAFFETAAGFISPEWNEPKNKDKFYDPVVAGDYISMKWNTPQGSYEGFGRKFEEGIFAAWGQAAWYGLIVYEIDKDGVIVGLSVTRKSSDAIVTGQMEKLRVIKMDNGAKDEFCGKFGVTGINYSSTSGQITYSGILNITKERDIYTLKWTQIGPEGAKFFGVGFRKGNKLGVAFGGDNDNFGVIDYSFSGSSRQNLTGRYINYSHSKAETENLTLIERSDNREKLIEMFQKYKPREPEQHWSILSTQQFKKGDIVELDEREEYMRWGEYKLVKLKGETAVLIDHNSSQYMGTDWESSDYFEVPKKKIRAKPKDSGKEINVGDLVEYKWENSWFYGRVTGINRGQFALDQYHGRQVDMWFTRSMLRHPVKENFKTFSIGEAVEYYWDYSWRKATIREINGLFTHIYDENADWDGWVHPYLLRKK